MSKVAGLLRLMRPANIITAIADILAGAAIAGFFTTSDSFLSLGLLIASTVGLYGGGVVFNDVFDADLDAVERPERPIPSGVVKKSEAMILGTALLLAGVFASFLVSSASGALALAIAFFALVYDKWGKHLNILGPVNMGLCRGLNLLLGISIITSQLPAYWPVLVVPVIYIAAVTMVSRGEVHGGSKAAHYLAVFLYALVIAAIATVSVLNEQWYGLIFLMAFGFMIFPPLMRAMARPEGPLIGKAVKAGVLALILMNASWAAAFGLPLVALGIVLLLPVSVALAKLFAVT